MSQNITEEFEPVLYTPRDQRAPHNPNEQRKKRHKRTRRAFKTRRRITRGIS